MFNKIALILFIFSTQMVYAENNQPSNAVTTDTHTQVSSRLTLAILKTKLAIYKLDSQASIPSTLSNKKVEFLSVTRTPDELSIVCDESLVSSNIGSVTTGWRAFKVDNGPLDFSLVGILSGILKQLAQAKISVFTLSTYNTDYVLVKEENLTKAIEVLKSKYIIKN
jgi:hypothetical protein